MDERSLRIEQRLEWPMVIASLLVIPAIVFQEASVGEPWKTVGNVLNWATWLAFVAEIAIMLSVVPDRRRWLRSHPLDLAITILTPPVVPPGLQFLRILRLLRPLRLLGALRMRRLLSLEGLRDTAVFAAIVILVSGGLYSEIEPRLNVWDGLWWAMGTATTAGSQYQPHTSGGRILAIILMVVGIGFVALLTAFVANRFVHTDEEGLGRQDEMIANQSEVLAKLELIEQRLERIEESGPARDTA